MATTWSKNTKKIKRVVATYAVGDGVLAAFLLSEIPKIITSLYRYSFIVINITCDGASENRSAIKSLGTETIEDVLGEYLSAERKILYPMKQVITFYHPIRSDILIFIGGKMPHLVKNCECI